MLRFAAFFAKAPINAKTLLPCTLWKEWIFKCAPAPAE